MDERYKIAVTDEAVEITGTLTIREAFDFLNFFEREGYTTLEDWGERTTLYLKKRDLEQENKNRIIQESIEDNKFYETQYKEEKIKSGDFRKRIDQLESLIQDVMKESELRENNYVKVINRLEKKVSLLKLTINEIKGKEEVKSLADAEEEQKIKYRTFGQTLRNFYIKQKVKVICLCQDFHFFNGETGEIVEIKDDDSCSLCIKVKFDTPRIYGETKDTVERIMEDFWFETEDICDIDKALKIEGGLQCKELMSLSDK